MAQATMTMDEGKKILVVSFTDHTTDPRVKKQIKALTEAGYDVHTVGKLPSGLNAVHYELPAKSYAGWKILLRTAAAKLGFDRWSLLLRYDTRKLESKLSGNHYDLVICNDLEPLPFAIKIKGKAKLVWDAHEYYPGEMDHDARWRFLYKAHVCRVLRHAVPTIDHAFTISPEIAELYKKEYGLECEVLMNLPAYADLVPGPVHPDKIKLVHHGIADPARRLDIMVNLVHQLPDKFELHFYLTKSGPIQEREYNRLVKVAQDVPRVIFHAPVPAGEIVSEINQYDMGLIIYPNHIPELNFCLPNKYFEFVQARLGIIVGRLETMSNFTRNHNLGVIEESEDTAELPQKLSALSAKDIGDYKNSAVRVATIFNSSEFERKLVQLVNFYLS
ncbi:MAG: glycosyltransferase [Flavobacteriales bacterium]|nr:glycosyltransferase [Flavobacteriales bacterium]